MCWEMLIEGAEEMEQCEMDRIEEMKIFLQEAEVSLLEERIKKIKSRCINNKKLKQEIMILIEGVVMERIEGCVVISYLRSSYVTGSHEFYIAYYANEPFVEEEPDSIYYGMRLLFDGVEDDLECLIKLLENKYIRIMASEKEEIRRWYIQQIYRKFYEVFKLLLTDMQKEKCGNIFYGSYMGEIKQL